ncbi:MAG TPA: hydrogenase small subunit [Thermoanaerobaculia bacterium]|nr:hydrogenase small subunit [Thermoanaerobaculia bacterium]
MSAEKDRTDTIADHLQRCGVSRRDFIGFCSKLAVVAPFGLAITDFLSPEAIAAEIGSAKRPSVIWLQMQDCTGCTETLLRPSQPDLATLILDIISLDYHETVMAASGHDAELALIDAMKANEGKYVLVVEGSIPTKDDGKFLKIGGKWGIDFLKEVAAKSAAIISIGSCASWGGVPSSGPNPTGAVGVDSIIKDKPIVNIPGCPPNPYILLGTVLQFAKAGTLPELDDKKRPKFAYDRVIHEHCPRRPHFDAGRFAKQFGDEGHRQGYCLYRLGCKGPVTHASCSTRHYNEVVDAWPIGVGAPCFGCTEQFVGYTIPAFQTVPISNATPPATYPDVGGAHDKGYVTATATGAAGLAGGIILGAGYVAARKFSNKAGDESVPGTEGEQK